MRLVRTHANFLEIMLCWFVISNNGFFLYKDGYNVYTKDRFNYKSNRRSKKINQAYAGDKHYNIYKLPKTTEELFLHNIPYDKICYEISLQLRDIILSTPSHTFENVNNVYGIDVEILNDYSTKIIEINSSPSLNFKDVQWKNKLIQEVNNCIQNSNYDTNSWVKILDNVN